MRIPGRPFTLSEWSIPYPSPGRASAGLFAAAQAIETVYKKLRRDGTTLGEESRLMGFERFNQLIGVAEKYALAERFGAV